MATRPWGASLKHAMIKNDKNTFKKNAFVHFHAKSVVNSNMLRLFLWTSHLHQVYWCRCQRRAPWASFGLPTRSWRESWGTLTPIIIIVIVIIIIIIIIPPDMTRLYTSIEPSNTRWRPTTGRHQVTASLETRRNRETPNTLHPPTWQSRSFPGQNSNIDLTKSIQAKMEISKRLTSSCNLMFSWSDNFMMPWRPRKRGWNIQKINKQTPPWTCRISLPFGWLLSVWFLFGASKLVIHEILIGYRRTHRKGWEIGGSPKTLGVFPSHK